MRCTAETIARQANKEDQTPGRFWQGRYRVQLLLDEALILACATYVGLNPARAALADRPGNSDCTGAKDRIDDLKQRQGTKRERRQWPSSKQERFSVDADDAVFGITGLGRSPDPCGQQWIDSQASCSDSFTDWAR